jgi:hypothetical protein
VRTSVYSNISGLVKEKSTTSYPCLISACFAILAALIFGALAGTVGRDSQYPIFIFAGVRAF